MLSIAKYFPAYKELKRQFDNLTKLCEMRRENESRQIEENIDLEADLAQVKEERDALRDSKNDWDLYANHGVSPKNRRVLFDLDALASELSLTADVRYSRKRRVRVGDYFGDHSDELYDWETIEITENKTYDIHHSFFVLTGGQVALKDTALRVGKLVQEQEGESITVTDVRLFQGRTNQLVCVLDWNSKSAIFPCEL